MKKLFVTPLLNTQVPFYARRSMAAASSGECIYFFGGVGAAGTESILDVSAELWCFDTTTATWRQIPQSKNWPSPRRCVGWIARGDRLLLWGGSGITAQQDSSFRHTFLNDEWEFDKYTEQWNLIRVSDDHLCSPLPDGRPFPRYTPVFQSVCNGEFLFGGYTEDTLGKRKLNDAWARANNGSWNQIPFGARQGYSSGSDWPGLRYGCMSAADNTAIYVCGGFSDDGDHNDLWRFDMTAYRWTLLAEDEVSVAAPEARYCAAFAYHEEKLFMFGGRSRRFPKRNFNDLWMFDLKTSRWVLISENSVPHRYDKTAVYPAYHAKASSAVMRSDWYIWGGEGINGHVSDFWKFDFVTRNWLLIQAARVDDPMFW